MSLIDLAVSAGRSLKGDETPFIHHYYGKTEKPHQAIPVAENLLYALALCRTKTVDGVQEAKALLEQLLAYQQPSGLFPVYLHEFPYCQDHYIGVHVLPQLYWIHHYFHSVLGEALAARLKTAIDQLLSATLAVIDKMPLRFQMIARGMAIACGLKNQIPLLEDNLKAFLLSESRFIPAHLGQAMTALTLAKSPSILGLYGWMKALFHPELGCYAGPFASTHFYEGRQEATLYDLYMGVFPKWAPSVLLQGALVFPHEALAVIQDQPTQALFGPDWALSWTKTGDYPLAFQWKQSEQAMACVIYAMEAEILDIHVSKERARIDLMLQEPKDKEVAIYFPLASDHRIRISGEQATTFRLNDQIELPRLRVSFRAPDGVFQGHITRGCCPTEMTNFASRRFDVHQWQVFLRSIQRPSPCQLSIQIEYAAS